MKQPTDDSTSSSDAELDQALARLPAFDLPPLAARAQLLAAERRLQRDASGHRWIERFEPPLLAACAAGHLLWALWRVLAASHGQLG